MKLKNFIILLIFFFFNSTGFSQNDSVVYFITMKYHFDILRPPEKVELVVPTFEPIRGRQEILNTKYSIKPYKFFKRDGKKFVKFLFRRPRKNFDLEIKSKIRIYRYDLESALQKRSPSKRIDSRRYLADAKLLKKNQLDVRQASKHLRGKTELETIENIFNYLKDNMNYEVQDKERGVISAVKNKEGDCTEFSAVFVTFCRAHGVPARMNYGLLGEGENTYHAWAEAYIKRHGWVPFEPQRYHRYDSLEPRFITISRDYHKNQWTKYRYWQGSVRLSESAKIEIVNEEKSSKKKRRRKYKERSVVVKKAKDVRKVKIEKPEGREVAIAKI